MKGPWILFLMVVACLAFQVAGGATVPEPEYYPVCADPQPTAPTRAVDGGTLYAQVSVAWNGREYAVAWLDAADNRMHFRRFFADGTPADDGKVVSTLNVYYYYPPSLVWNGNGYGVLWAASSGSYFQVYFARLDVTGTMLGAPVKVSFSGISETAHSFPGNLATSGDGYAAVWNDQRNGTEDIFATLLDADGNVTHHDLTLCSAVDTQNHPVVAWSEAVSRYQVVWSDRRSGSQFELYGCYLRPNGALGTASSIVSTSLSATLASLAEGAGGFGLVWQDFRDGNAEVYFARVSGEGAKIGSDVRLTEDSAAQNFPCVIWTGAEFGVFWSDSRSGNYDTWFQRVSAGGAAVGSNLPVTYSGGLAFPAAAFGRYGYLASAAYTNVGHGAGYVSPWGCASDATPPTCPVNLVAYSVTGTSATVAWIPSVEDATDLAYYEVYRNSSLVARTSENYYADSGLALNTTYNYYVRPVNAAQLVNGTCTSTSSIYVKTNATLTLLVDKSAPDARLTWTDASMGFYNVFRGTSPQVMSQIGSTGDLSFDDANVLADNVLYFYTVDEPGM